LGVCQRLESQGVPDAILIVAFLALNGRKVLYRSVRRNRRPRAIRFRLRPPRRGDASASCVSEAHRHLASSNKFALKQLNAILTECRSQAIRTRDMTANRSEAAHCELVRLEQPLTISAPCSKVVAQIELSAKLILSRRSVHSELGGSSQ